MKSLLNMVSIATIFFLMPAVSCTQSHEKASTKVTDTPMTDDVRKELVRFYGEEAIDSLLLPSNIEVYYIFDWYTDALIQDQLRVLDEFAKLPEHVVGSSGMVNIMFLPGPTITDVERWETGFFSFGFGHFIGTTYMYSINSEGEDIWQFDIDYRIVSGDTLYLGKLWRDSDTLVTPKSEHFDNEAAWRARRFIESAGDAMHRVNEKY